MSMSIPVIKNPIEQSIEVISADGKLLNIVAMREDETEPAHVVIAIYNDGYEQERNPTAYVKISPEQFARELRRLSSLSEALINSPLASSGF